MVRGIYDVSATKPLLGEIAVSQKAFDNAFSQPKNSLTLLDGTPAAAAIPWPMLAAFTLVTVLARIGAAIMPARRASRLDVLDALHHE